MVKSKILLILTLFLVLFALSKFSINLFADDSEYQITMTGTENVKIGSTYQGSVYINSLKNISTLSVSVHYNSDIISITDSNTYNIVSCNIYDYNLNDGELTYSYLFNTTDTASNTFLFVFYYTIKSDAVVGDTYFDIVINEAYDSSLNSIDVSGYQYEITVSENIQTKSCYLTGTYSVSSKMNEEFTLKYSFSTNEIASGTVEISYDASYFEFVSLEQRAMLNNKTVDVNSAILGTIYLSFIGTEYESDSAFIALNFKTIANVGLETNVTVTPTNLYDKSMNLIKCSSYSSKVILSYDKKLDDTLPKMYLNSVTSLDGKSIDVTAKLSSNANLGAGDFTISWDTDRLTFVSYEQKILCDYFIVNVDDTSSGVLKFSIISLTDIVDGSDVIKLKFDVVSPQNTTITNINVTGNNITNSLAESIYMNFNGFGISATLLPLAVLDEINISHSCSFTNNLQLNYYIPIASLDGYDNPRLVIKKDRYTGGNHTVDEYTVYGTITGDEYRFVFANIPAAEIGDGISATLYVTKDETQYYRASDTFNVMSYVNNRLVYSTNDLFKTMLVDMVNYCAQAQIYFGYRTDSLVNANLTEEQKNLGSSNYDELVDSYNINQLDTTTAFFTGKSVVFGNNVELKFYMDLSNVQTDLSKVYLKVTYQNIVGTTIELKLDSSSFAYNSTDDEYSVKISSLAICEARNDVTICIMSEDEVISDTITYSLESYAFNRINGTSNLNFKLLLEYMMKYADSSKKYLER